MARRQQSRAPAHQVNNGNMQEQSGLPDLLLLNEITHEAINANLRARYLHDEIYTFAGSILVSVNPYKQLDIYNDEWLARYRGQKFDPHSPHIFALAELMYSSMTSSWLFNDSATATPTHAIASTTQQRTSNQSNRSSIDHNSNPMSVCNQACVISGESGAGKTETTKFILSYVCSVTPNKSTWLEHQILEASTILEAFGNAKTVRNDNSSRFGKFIQICFNSRHLINGCIIQDYLLEQSRITYQSAGERNYHVFYQLLAAGQANEQLRQKFHLMPPSFYDYLNRTQCCTIDGVDDCSMFDSLRMAMSVLNMEQESCESIFSVLSSILWLGNLHFQGDESAQNEQSRFTENDQGIILTIAQLLGLNRELLEPIMLKRQINVRGTVTEIPFRVHEARDNRNGMAKALYSRLFSWIVNFINTSTDPGADNACFLGVLDIFGFENFEVNSFEQLCINYANEKLHKFFNHHMFAMEQELYRREEIDFCDINYTDNSLCLELLERPPSCILRLLSEECRMPKGNDITFVEKLHLEFASTSPHPYYIKGYDRRNWSSQFAIRHFAGSVTYSVDGFIKKNRDAQQSQLLDIIETSSCSLLREMIRCPGPIASSERNESLAPRLSGADRRCSFDSLSRSTTSNNTGYLKMKLQTQQSLSCSNSSGLPSPCEIQRNLSFSFESSNTKGPGSIFTNSSTKTKPTVADTFRYQLTALVELLNSVNPWYVRCIKPNLEKSAIGYDDDQVMLQLKYLGMSDLIRIRREGFLIHLTKQQFCSKYSCLLSKKMDGQSIDILCREILSGLQLDPNDWKLGRTMVLMRPSVHQPLEELRNNLLVEKACILQKIWRGYTARKKFEVMKSAAIRIQETFRAFRGRLLFLRKRRAALTIQAYVRGMFAREIANALREIKRAERGQAKAQVDQSRAVNTTEETHDETPLEPSMDQAANSVEIRITSPGESSIRDSGSECPTEVRSELSPSVSSVISSVVEKQNSADRPDSKKRPNSRDRQEMEELIKILERHGISLDAQQNGEVAYADIEKLYDVLGNRLQVNGEAQSISPSTHEDDRMSFATVGTTCDGDSVSCSGQSQISSTLTDDQTYNDNGDTSARSPEYNHESSSEARDDTVNHNQDAAIRALDENNYQSNSVESIASIVSSSSVQSSQLSATHNQTIHQNDPPVQPETVIKQVREDPPSRTSTFGNSFVVTGSKLVTNGRPLARIEEEPSSTATSPAQSPRKRLNSASSRASGLFPPEELDQNINSNKLDQISESKRRRLERRILQVQQDELLRQPISPTTAGLPVPPTQSQKTIQTEARADSQKSQDDSAGGLNDDNIYGQQKSSIIDYAEQIFNQHPRDASNVGVIRTLTRRKKGGDSSVRDYLSKAEMLSYNSAHIIPTSHVKMHDPHNVQISCSMFKNLCRYMTGESAKSDTEVRIIQSIIRHGIETMELRDEIYVQITRQLTNNPHSEYSLRLWVLMGLVSAAFSPSKTFAQHLVAYLRSKPKKDPSITCHAQFCLDNLQAPRFSPRKYPPSILEIQACKNLTNLSIKIHLLDGRCETVSIHPIDTALDTLTKLAQRINLQSIEGWALYESYTSGASRFPHPAYEQKGDFERSVKSFHYMADLLSAWQCDDYRKSITSANLKVAQRRLDEGNFKLTLKKRIFRGPKIRNDPVEINLLYAQAVYNVVKKDSFLVDENLALSLAGLQAQVMLGNATDLCKQTVPTKKSRSKQVLKHSVQIYDTETYICQRLRTHSNRSKKEWSNLISQSHRQFRGVNDTFCKMRYLSMVIYHCPLYGTATFKVTYKGYQTLDQNLTLGVNAEGLVLIRSSDKALLSAFRYSEICLESSVTVFAEENMIQFNVNDKTDNTAKCLSFEAHDHEEIVMLLVSYAPSLNVCIRGASNESNFTLDPSFDQNFLKRKSKLKMTLEDRMRTHQEVQNARKVIIRSGKLRKPQQEEHAQGLLKHTLRRLAPNKNRVERSARFENIYGSLRPRSKDSLPQTSSDYNIYSHAATVEGDKEHPEVAGATASLDVDELTKNFPHRYWAYTKYPLTNSLMTIYDPDLEEAALSTFNAVLTYSGLLDYNSPSASLNASGHSSALDSSSTDSGIASQQGYNNSKGSVESPSSISSGDIYDVCPRKMDERDRLKLAQSILDRCLRKDADILKNEFFLQLIKQTTDHPDPNSEINQRHWQLLALACSVTYPSDCKILAYLFAHLRRCSLDQITNEGRYSQFTLRSLQGTLDTKGRKYAPSETEILSTINCRRVYARVYFLDGQFQAVEFDPCATIAEVVDQIKQKVGLRQGCGGYALFQPLDDECEQVLQPEEKVGDAITAWETWQRQRQARLDHQAQQHQQISQGSSTRGPTKASIASLTTSAKNRTHRFIFKKYLFLDSLTDLNDPVERELLYYQIVANIKEDKFPILEQEATILCALKAQIELGDYTKLANLPREHIKMIYKQVIMSLMPPHTFNSLPVPAIAQQHQSFRDLDCADTKKYFFNLIQTFGRASSPHNPSYVLLHRAHIYEATQTFATAWPSDIWIAINQTGLHMLASKSRRVLASCEYGQVVDHNSSNNYLVLILLTGAQNRLKYTFYTKQAQQIAQQMKDYIVMNSSNRTTKRRKSVEFNLKQQTPKQLETRDATYSPSVQRTIQCG